MDRPSQRDLNAQGDHGIRTARVRWTDPLGLPLTFSNIMMSQFTPQEFIITFGQVLPPNTLGLGEDEIQDLAVIEGLTVARIVLTPEKMRELVQTLQRNLEQYETLLTEQGQEEE